MENKPCLSTIRAEYTNLTNREQLLADYILQNYEKVVTMTTAELAKNAGTVKSMVIRLCQSLGFAGYTEFKLLLSRELARNEQFGFTPYICKDDHPADILKKIFSANIKTLHDTLAGLDMNVYHAAVAALDRAEHIYIYGIGTSAGIAADFHYRLIEIGRNAFYYTDVVSMRISTLNIQKNDVVLGISNSGRTASTVDVLRRAREHGAQTAIRTARSSRTAIIRLSSRRTRSSIRSRPFPDVLRISAFWTASPCRYPRKTMTTLLTARPKTTI